MLDRQIRIYSVDTGNFYSNHEVRLHLKNHKARMERKQLVDGYVQGATATHAKRIIIGTKTIETQLASWGLTEEDLASIAKGTFDGELCEEARTYAAMYKRAKDLIKIKNRVIKETKEELLALLNQKMSANEKSGGKHHIRELRVNSVSKMKEISVFDSALTRTIGAKIDELCEDFMVVQVYYFSVFKDIQHYGFMYNGEKYIYLTSSAGQIRTKKGVFIRESVWNEHKNTLMCGLSIEEINRRGGANPNKYLAYMALNNSATDVWEEFDITKTIVIDDFETNVAGTYDLVDETDYSIHRTTGQIPIPHTDGAGMILPNAFGKRQRNKMFRSPWIKGLLGVFDFKAFIVENGCSPVIRDIYGVEHDVLAEGIEVIFCKSQFKMAKYYDSWEDYQEKYIRHGCVAGYANPEEERIKDATINYQMLQTLTDITDEEIVEIAGESVSRLKNITSTAEDMKRSFGISAYNTSKTCFQQAVELYPNLLNDEYVKDVLREIKGSMVKRYKAGKLNISGKYTFLMPDFYAACEHWFQGIENPKGLLDDGEVFCWLFRGSEKLDCLRSPHLFCEHAVRNNAACSKDKEKQRRIRAWFVTDAIYTSCKDMISKILQFDVDGDKALVISNKTLIRVAERNLEEHDIVPLYYNMRKAEPEQLCNETIYGGLNAAFIGGNIGIYSNSISKIWNSDVFVSGTKEEQREAIDVIKLLCCENNFVIDYAKTLYKPVRTKEADERITKYTGLPLPHFFKYAKDKQETQISKTNNSFVNRLESVIQNPRLSFRRLGLGKPDYHLLMHDPNAEVLVGLTDKGKVIREDTDPLILAYNEMIQKYGCLIRDNRDRVEDSFSVETLMNSQVKQDLVYRSIVKEIKAYLEQFGYTDIEITDILVKYLYGIRKNKHKAILWACYGEIILENLKKHFKLTTKAIQCVDCGEWFEVEIKNVRTCRCGVCQAEHRRESFRESKRVLRSKAKNDMSTDQKKWETA